MFGLGSHGHKVALVEDLANVGNSYKKLFGDNVIIATSEEEVVNNLLPHIDEIAIFFLDIEILNKTRDEVPDKRAGFRAADAIHKLLQSRNLLGKIPRICTSGLVATDGTLDDELAEYFGPDKYYTGYVKKMNYKEIIVLAATAGVATISQ